MAGVIQVQSELIHFFYTELALKDSVPHIIYTYGLILCRLVPVIMFAPFLGGKVMPAQAKIGLALLFAFLLYPYVGTEDLAPLPSAFTTYLLLMGKEILIGFLLGFGAAIFFFAVDSAGAIMSNVAGTNQSVVLVPQMQTRTAPFGAWYTQYVLALFFILGVHQLYITALFESFITIPVTSFPIPPHGFFALVDWFMRYGAELMVIAVTLAAPVIVAIVILEIVFACLNTIAPQVNVYFLGMIIKPYLAVALVFVSLNFLVDQMSDHMGGMMRFIRGVLGYLGGPIYARLWGEHDGIGGAKMNFWLSRRGPKLATFKGNCR